MDALLKAFSLLFRVPLAPEKRLAAYAVVNATFLCGAAGGEWGFLNPCFVLVFARASARAAVVTGTRAVTPQPKRRPRKP
jgi:hypothetical protein